MKICKHCGEENPDHKNWCKKCMKPLRDDPAEALPLSPEKETSDKTVKSGIIRKTPGDSEKLSNAEDSFDKAKMENHGRIYGSMGPKNKDVPEMKNEKEKSAEEGNSGLKGRIGRKEYGSGESNSRIIRSTQRYCTRCSAQVDEEETLCQKCRNRKKKTKTICLRVVAALLVVAMWSGLAVYFVGKRTPKVKNAEQAISVLKDLGEEWGYENAFSELTEKNTTTTDGDTYYRLQQNYRGIPVYGKTVVYSTDSFGNVSSITGNVRDVDLNINLVPSITSEQAGESIRVYVTETLGRADTNISMSESIICIYNGCKLALDYTVTMSGNFYETYEVLVDAHDAEILEWNTYVVSFDTNQDILGAADVNCEFDDSHNLKLVDTQRNHSVHYLDLKTYQEYPMVEDVVDNSDFLATAVPDQTASGETYALANLAQIYDFYVDVLERQSYNNQGAPVYLLSCDADLADFLADQGKALACPEYGVIMLGAPVSLFSNYLGKAMDLVAHEYTHLIFQTEVGLSQDLDVTSVNEGIADIFGNLIELFAEGKQDPSWPLAEDAGYIKYNMADHTTMASYGNDAHNNAQILSHCAYLMWNGIDGNTAKEIDIDALAKLWYRAMLMMPSDCNFVECRTLVELAASTMNLTDMQKQCVCEAFDAVGIPRASEEEYSELVHLVTDGETAVKGTVYEVKTMDGIETVVPVPKAMLTVYDEASSKVYKKLNMKNKDGFFEIELPAGTYSVSITAEGYIGQTITFELDGNEVRYLSIAMETVAEEPTETPVEFPHNNRTKRLSQVKVMNQGTLLETHVFQYDSNGRLIGTDITYNVPDSYTWEANCRYTYDSEGRLLEADRDDNWTCFGNERFEYDSNGNLLSYKWYWGGNGFDIPYSQIDYRYNSDGILIGETHYSLEYEDDEEYVKKDEEFSVDCTYDNQNKLISKRKTISWIDDDYDFKMTTSIGKHLRSELEFITEYSYNDDGLISREHSYYKHDGDASDGDIVIYQYDKKPFVVTMYEDDGMKIAINDISGNEIWSIIVDRVITDNDGYIVSASIGWEDEFITDYEFIYDDYDESEDGTSQAKNALAAYKPVAEKYNVSSEEQAFGWYSGILIDLDNDNVQELVMRYLSAPFEDAWWSEHKFSVYDYENGKVVTKLDGVTFGEIGGAGEDAYATVLYKSGKPYIMTYNDFGETSPGGSMKPNRVGMMTIYDGKTCKEVGVYRIERWDNVMSYQIDQRTVSEKEFVSEIEQYQGVNVVCDLYQLIEFPRTFVTVSKLLQQMK